MLHVPYRGSAPAITDLLGGQVQVYFAPISASLAYIRAGKLRALPDATEKSLHQLEQINQKLDRILAAIDKLFAK
jgi:tripartite-type tricarboxylate transporter receptor subunit TctC